MDDLADQITHRAPGTFFDRRPDMLRKRLVGLDAGLGSLRFTEDKARHHRRVPVMEAVVFVAGHAEHCHDHVHRHTVCKCLDQLDRALAECGDQRGRLGLDDVEVAGQPVANEFRRHDLSQRHVFRSIELKHRGPEHDAKRLGVQLVREVLVVGKDCRHVVVSSDKPTVSELIEKHRLLVSQLPPHRPRVESEVHRLERITSDGHDRMLCHQVATVAAKRSVYSLVRSSASSGAVWCSVGGRSEAPCIGSTYSRRMSSIT